MTAAALLAHLRSLGARVSLTAKSLRVSAPPGVVDEPIKAALNRHKPEIARILRRGQPIADVVIEAHGVEFVITPRGRSPRGSTLTHYEVGVLMAATKGQPLTREMVHALAAAKRVFPEASIESVVSHVISKEPPNA